MRSRPPQERDSEAEINIHLSALVESRGVSQLKTPVRALDVLESRDPPLSYRTIVLRKVVHF
jgi:hypothetical protein